MLSRRRNALAFAAFEIGLMQIESEIWQILPDSSKTDKEDYVYAIILW